MIKQNNTICLSRVYTCRQSKHIKICIQRGLPFKYYFDPMSPQILLLVGFIDEQQTTTELYTGLFNDMYLLHNRVKTQVRKSSV